MNASSSIPQRLVFLDNVVTAKNKQVFTFLGFPIYYFIVGVVSRWSDGATERGRG